MTIRLPLLAKIIGWFFLNLLVLGVAGWYLLRDQFAFSMFASRTAGDRVAHVSTAIVAELGTSPRNQWDDVLAHYSRVHGVDFYLYDSEAERVAGPKGPLPPEVHSRLIGATQARGNGRPPRNDNPPRPRNDGPPGRDDGRIPGIDDPAFDDAPFDNGPPPRDDDPPFRNDGRRPPPRFDGPPGFPGQGRPPGPRALRREIPDKVLVQSGNPERYWVFARVTVPAGSFPQEAALIAMSDSPTGHGLYFDPSPLLWAGAGVLLLSALVWFPLVRGITVSIARMRAATSRLAEGAFETRVVTRRSDELGELGSDINRMAGRLAGYVEGQRRFLGDVAHELCAPVARLQMAVGILEQGATTPADQERLADVRDEVEHMAGLVNELLQFTRAAIGGKQVVLQAVPLRPIAEKALDREAADPSQTRLEVDAALSVRVEPDLLQRALGNLIRNAIRYAGQAGAITVSAVREGADIFLSVTDQGPGVPADALPKLFEPFYRVDTVRTPGAGGAGLGLAIVKTCVEVCGGAVTVRNVLPTGLEVTLRLPAA